MPQVVPKKYHWRQHASSGTEQVPLEACRQYASSGTEQVPLEACPLCLPSGTEQVPLEACRLARQLVLNGVE